MTAWREPMQHDFITGVGMNVATVNGVAYTDATWTTEVETLQSLGFNGIYQIAQGGDLATVSARARVCDALRMPINLWCRAIYPYRKADLGGGVSAVLLTPQAKMLARHPSVIGGLIYDEPVVALTSQMAIYNAALVAVDPYRSISPKLIPDGVPFPGSGDSTTVAPQYTAIAPLTLDLDGYPYRAGAEMNTDMVVERYGAITLAQYYATCSSELRVGAPFDIQLQAYQQLDTDNVRWPLESEIHQQFWTAVQAGANAVYWFCWESDVAGFPGIRDDNSTVKQYVLDLISSTMSPAVRTALKRTIAVTANWTATNGATITTRANVNRGQTAAGARRFVIVRNNTTSTIVTGLAPIAGGPFNLTNLYDGTVRAGVVGNTYSLLKGRGLLFEVTS